LLQIHADCALPEWVVTRIRGSGRIPPENEEAMQLAASEYQKLDLWAHSFLADVPLHDAFVLDLPGGGQGRTMQDVRAIFSADVAAVPNLNRNRWVFDSRRKLQRGF
jgi:hypothetical protein